MARMNTLLIVGVAAVVPVVLALFRYGPVLFEREPRLSAEEQAAMWRDIWDAYRQGYEAGMRRN